MIRKLILVVLASILIVVPTVAVAQGPADTSDKGGEEIWNHLPSQVIRHQSAGLPNELVQNGGVGDGANLSYFCSGQDEADAYLGHHGSYPSSGTWSRIQSEESNKGEYNFIIIEDRCRTEGGCGDIQPDGKCVAIGIPTHAMDSHSLGQRRAFDTLFYEQNPGGVSEWGQQPPRDPDHEAWQGRNSIDDQFGFLYGRYLINEIDCPYQDPTAVPLGPLMEVRVPIPSSNPKARNPYHPLSYERPFLDIPYNLPALRWFACGGVARLDGYKANPLWRRGNPRLGGGRSGEQELDDWTIDHYKTRLAMAVNRLGREISEGVFGAGSAGSPRGTLDTEIRETVVTPWNALKKMIDRIPGDCSNQDCSWLRFEANWFRGDTVDIRCCETATGSIVEYQPDEERICISHEICGDCRAQWDKGVVSMPNDLSCFPPPGPDGILTERLYGTNPGYETFIGPDSSGVRRLQVREGSGDVRSEGYSSIIVALLSHALIEAECHQRTGRNCLEGWPGSLEAHRIEEIARLGQSLVYYELGQLHLSPLTFGMEKKEFVSSVSFNSGQPSRLTRGQRYFYGSECRGRQGINLNPLCFDMLNIVRQLLLGRPVVAKTMALWMSVAPNVDPPPLQTVNGVEGPFVMPREVGPLEPYTPPRVEPIPNLEKRIQLVPEGQEGGVPPGSLSDSPFPPEESERKERPKK